MLWKCRDCGAVTDDPDVRTEYGGCGYTEEFYVCGICGGKCDEAKECEICHDYDFEDSLTCGICNECFKELITVDNVLYFAEEIDDLYEFLTKDLFQKNEIIDILKREIKNIPEKRLKDTLTKYAEDDDYSFIESILKKKRR